MLAAGIGQARAFPAERAFEHLEAQCAVGPRNPGSPGHEAIREYIHDVLAASGGRVVEQTFRQFAPGLEDTVTLTNLIATFGPSGKGGLLLGAHWDTRPWADRDPDPARRGEPILGANDGASGTALLLALAETFRDQPPDLPVTLVFFDGEDLGRESHSDEYLAGSRHFAALLTGALPEAAVVVDMVASATMQLAVEEQSRAVFPELAALVEQLALEEHLTSFLPGSGPSVTDDHVPLIEAGIPTILLIDFRDPYWHTLGDRPEHCSARSLDQAGRLVELLVRGGFFRSSR